jgi:hypothetical protein
LHNLCRSSVAALCQAQRLWSGTRGRNVASGTSRIEPVRYQHPACASTPKGRQYSSTAFDTINPPWQDSRLTMMRGDVLVERP